MRNLIIIGDGGHKKVVLDVAKQLGYQLVGIMDDHVESIIEQEGIKKFNRNALNEMQRSLNALLFFGIGNNQVRAQIVASCHLKDEAFATLVSPHAVIGSNVAIGAGTLVMPNVVVNSDAKIGKHVILNTSSVIEHDCIVDDYAHISPGAVLTGAVKVGKYTQIGANAVVNPLVQVGENVIIGSGASVIRNIEANNIAVGVPAKVIQTKELT